MVIERIQPEGLRRPEGASWKGRVLDIVQHFVPSSLKTTMVGAAERVDDSPARVAPEFHQRSWRRADG